MFTQQEKRQQVIQEINNFGSYVNKKNDKSSYNGQITQLIFEHLCFDPIGEFNIIDTLNELEPQKDEKLKLIAKIRKYYFDVILDKLSYRNRISLDGIHYDLGIFGNLILISTNSQANKHQRIMIFRKEICIEHIKKHAFQDIKNYLITSLLPEIKIKDLKKDKDNLFTYKDKSLRMDVKEFDPFCKTLEEKDCFLHEFDTFKNVVIPYNLGKIKCNIQKIFYEEKSIPYLMRCVVFTDYIIEIQLLDRKMNLKNINNEDEFKNINNEDEFSLIQIIETSFTN